jgi:hypothetical protein
VVAGKHINQLEWFLFQILPLFHYVVIDPSTMKIKWNIDQRSWFENWLQFISEPLDVAAWVVALSCFAIFVRCSRCIYDVNEHIGVKEVIEEPEKIAIK